MSTILSFIRNLYIKQQSNILRSLWGLKFENSLFNNISCTFRGKKIVYTAEKERLKYSVQN